MHLNVEVASVEDAVASAARDKIGAAASLLVDVAPTQARWVRRYIRLVLIADLRTQRFLTLTHGLVLGAEFAAGAAEPAVALLLLLAALRARLAPLLPRWSSGDRRAQYWWRIRTEMRIVARRLDQAEDPSGYIPGVSQARWENWVETWLGRTALHRGDPGRLARRLARDLRRMDAPRWLVRAVLSFLRWRWRAV